MSADSRQLRTTSLLVEPISEIPTPALTPHIGVRPMLQIILPRLATFRKSRGTIPAPANSSPLSRDSLQPTASLDFATAHLGRRISRQSHQEAEVRATAIRALRNIQMSAPPARVRDRRSRAGRPSLETRMTESGIFRTCRFSLRTVCGAITSLSACRMLRRAWAACLAPRVIPVRGPESAALRHRRR